MALEAASGKSCLEKQPGAASEKVIWKKKLKLPAEKAAWKGNYVPEARISTVGFRLRARIPPPE